MDSDRENHDLLFAISWRLRRVEGNLRFSRDTMRREALEIDLWNHQKRADMIPMYRLLHEYRHTRNSNQMIIANLEVFLFYWHHVIDAFARETPAWRINNIELVQERIVHALDLDEIIRAEIGILTERMRRNRMANH